MSLQLIRPDINLDFVGKRYFFIALSTVINIAAIVLLFTRGPQLRRRFCRRQRRANRVHRPHQRRRDSRRARAARSWRSHRPGLRQGRPVFSRALPGGQEHRQHRAQARDRARQSLRPGRREGGASGKRRRQSRQRFAPQGLLRGYHRDHLHGRVHRDPVPPRELEFRRRHRDCAHPRRAGRDVRAGDQPVPVRSDHARRGADRYRLLGP